MKYINVFFFSGMSGSHSKNSFVVVDDAGRIWEEIDVNGVKCMSLCVGSARTYTLNEAERIAHKRGMKVVCV